MKNRYTKEGVVFSVEAIRAQYPNMSIPDDADLTDIGYATLKEMARPAAMLWHRVVEGPVEGDTLTWVQQSMTAAEIEAECVAEIDKFADQKAVEVGFDSRITALCWASVTGANQEKAKIFATWLDACYTSAKTLRVAVLSGERDAPSITDLLAQMPEYPA